MGLMKKVLIFAYDFPPYVSVGGLRPYSWYKYLKEYGIEPNLERFINIEI